LIFWMFFKVSSVGWGLALLCVSKSPLLSSPGRFLRTESLSVCRIAQYVPLTISSGFWKWKSSTPWQSQKQLAHPGQAMTQLQTFWSHVNRNASIAWGTFRFGLEVMDTLLISKFCWVRLHPQPDGEKSVSVRAPFMSFVLRIQFCGKTPRANFRKCRRSSVVL
jgi:hypothetical protein